MSSLFARSLALCLFALPVTALAVEPMPKRPDKAGKAQQGRKPQAPPEAADAEPAAALEAAPLPKQTELTLNLENATLDDLVRLISSVTGKRFILQQGLPEIRVSVYAPGKVSAKEAYQAFLSILELHGLALVEAGGYAKIVPSKDIQRRPIEWRSDASAPAGSDAFLVQLYHVQHAEPSGLSALLEQFKSLDGSIQVYEPTRMLVLTDTGHNVRRMLELLHTVDVPRASGRVWIEPLRHADAAELSARIGEVLEATRGDAVKPAAPSKRTRSADSGPLATSETTPVGESPKLFAETRTNALVIVGSEHTYLRVLELVRALDVPLPGDGGIHVHRLEYATAEALAKTLGSLVSESRQGKATAGGEPAGLTFEGKISITADVTTNALVVTSSLRDYQTLERVIDDLDQPRRQVFIEAVILDLDASKDSELGINLHSGAANIAGQGSIGAVASNGLGGVSSLLSSESLSGLALGLSGRSIDVAGVDVPSFGVALRALASTSQSSVLSTPHLIAMENEQAEINIGSNEPLQGSAVPGALANAAALSGSSASTLSALGSASSVERRDVGIKLRITPHINERGEIHMEIEQESSSLGALATGNLNARSINTRTAKTSVLVKNQETVVIGGMVQERLTKTRTGIPLLSDIPLLGRLFTTEKVEKKRGNLLLFLTPYLLNSQDDLRAIYARKLEEREIFLEQKALFSGSLPRLASFERGTGLVGELLRAQHERARLEKDVASEPSEAPGFEHTPRAPITGSLETAQAAVMADPTPHVD